MAPLLVWELISPPENYAVERLTLDDDGAVSRRVTQPGSTDDPAVGWWTGALDRSVVAAAKALAERDWPSGDTRSRPPAAGAWWAQGPNGRVGLWSPSTEDEVRPALSALRAACAEAASRATSAVQLSARWAEMGGEQVPLLGLVSIGDQQMNLTLQHPAEAPPAAFLTDDGEVLGFLGDQLWLPAGTSVHGLLRSRLPGPGGLELAGSMAKPDGETASVRVVVQPA